MNIIIVTSTIDGIDARYVEADEIVLSSGESIIRPYGRNILVVT